MSERKTSKSPGSNGLQEGPSPGSDGRKAVGHLTEHYERGGKRGSALGGEKFWFGGKVGSFRSQGKGSVIEIAGQKKK